MKDRNLELASMQVMHRSEQEYLPGCAPILENIAKPLAPITSEGDLPSRVLSALPSAKESASEGLKKAGWVDVKERLPEEGLTVIVATAEGNVALGLNIIGEEDEQEWQVDFVPWSPQVEKEDVEVIHWTYLPIHPDFY